MILSFGLHEGKSTQNEKNNLKLKKYKKKINFKSLFNFNFKLFKLLFESNYCFSLEKKLKQLTAVSMLV